MYIKYTKSTLHICKKQLKGLMKQNTRYHLHLTFGNFCILVDMQKIFLFCLYAALVSFMQNEDRLDYFTGKWEIKMWTGKETKREPDISGTWFMDKDPDSAKGYKGYVQIGNKAFTSEVISYDEKDKHYTRIISVSTGAKITLRTAGWIKDGLVWTGEQDDGSNKLKIKEEITKKGRDEFRAVFYELRKEKWVLAQTEILKRLN
jgi:hypothetical protein